MEIYRTPDDRFAGLAGFPFRPYYHNVPAGDGSGLMLRLHFLDEGPADGDPVVLLHGEPTWSYLYREMVEPLADAGHRVLVPDFIGFGRSDKPTSPDDYSYQHLVDWMETWLLDLDLTRIILFGQDWGGLVGLRLVAGHPDRFGAVAVANTGLPTGDHEMTEAFLRWQAYAASTPTLPVAKLLQNSTVTTLPDDVLAAYEAPFPEEAAMAGARVLPSLVPTRPDDPAAAANRAAWEVLRSFDRPFVTMFSDSDPITTGGERPFQRIVPGARGRDHPTIRDAGHFLQEDDPGELARHIVDLAAAAGDDS